MPPLRRRAKLQRRTLMKQHAIQLLLGHDVFGDAFGREPNLDEVREAWNQCREKLLPAWIKYNSGTRCWSWWKFDSGSYGPRERVDGPPHPFRNPERQRHIEKLAEQYPDAGHLENATALQYGLPARLYLPDDFDAEFESEANYLNRHRLLTDAERRALAATPEGNGKEDEDRTVIPPFEIEHGELCISGG